MSRRQDRVNRSRLPRTKIKIKIKDFAMSEKSKKQSSKGCEPKSRRDF